MHKVVLKSSSTWQLVVQRRDGRQWIHSACLVQYLWAGGRCTVEKWDEWAPCGWSLGPWAYARVSPLYWILWAQPGQNHACSASRVCCTQHPACGYTGNRATNTITWVSDSVYQLKTEPRISEIKGLPDKHKEADYGDIGKDWWYGPCIIKMLQHDKPFSHRPKWRINEWISIPWQNYSTENGCPNCFKWC